MSRTVYSRNDYWNQLDRINEYHASKRGVEKPEFAKLEPDEPLGLRRVQPETPDFPPEPLEQIPPEDTSERITWGLPPPLEQKEPDKYTSRLLKYIPAEVIALYLTLDALIRTSEQLPISVYWIVFVVCLVLTYFYLHRVEKVDKNIQLLISVVAFCVWVFAIGGPFVYLNWYQPIYGGLLLPTYTLLVAIIEA